MSPFTNNDFSLRRYEKVVSRRLKIFKILTGVSVKVFQVKNGLIPDGLLGNKTVQILKRQIF